VRIWIGLGLACLAWGQLPRPIEGTVVNALTGEPLRRVSVQVLSVARPMEPVVTDSLGRFRLPELPPGRLQLRATRPGYFTESGTDDLAVDLKPSDRPAVIQVRLFPGGSVSGAVTDETGEPVVGAQVMLLRRTFVGGRRQFSFVASGITDDRGGYRLFGLPPQSYLVRVVAPRVPGDPQLYPPVFFPAANEPGKATPLTLAAGQEQRGINISLRSSASYRVTGRVLNGLTNSPLSNISLSMATRGASAFVLESAPQVQVRDPEGRFTFTGLSPGQYTMSGAYNNNGQLLRARMALDVSGDIDNVVVTMQPGVLLRGRIRVEGEGAIDLTRLGVVVESVEELWNEGSSTVTADGTFSIVQPLPPGRYSPNVNRLPPGAFLQAVLIGEREGSLDLSGAAGQTVDTVWVISLRGGTVEGRALPGNVVALVPDLDATNRRSRYRAAVADAEGRFVLPGVAPGSYSLYAFTKVEAGAWMDDEYLAAFPDRGVGVKVEERETKTVDVKAQ
jgi:hypothetical protein